MKIKILLPIIIGCSFIMTACVGQEYNETSMTRLGMKDDNKGTFSEENEQVNVGTDSEVEDNISYSEQYNNEEIKVCKRINYYNSYGELYTYEIPEYVDDLEVGGTWYSSDGNAALNYKYEYDEWGNITKEISFNIDGSEHDRSEYEYDEYGNKQLERDISNGKIDNYYEFEYDENGNCTLEQRYNVYGTKQYHFVNEYDNLNRKIKSIWYNDYSGDKTHYIEYEYDEWNNCINEFWYKSDGTLDHRIVRIYE